MAPAFSALSICLLADWLVVGPLMRTLQRKGGRGKERGVGGKRDTERERDRQTDRQRERKRESQ